MLKLGGWPRPSWGRIPSRRLCIDAWVRITWDTYSSLGPNKKQHRLSAHSFHPPLVVVGQRDDNPLFNPPHHRWARRATLHIRGLNDTPIYGLRLARSDATLDAQADVPLAGWPRAQLAFKDSMVRGILQFAPRIAFRCALHRCESRDIHCRESFKFTRCATALHATEPITELVFQHFLGAKLRRFEFSSILRHGLPPKESR